jgi:GT2 family glycosyltransferase
MLRDLSTVAVIVVNWNRCEDTLRCLASLAAVDYPALTTFLVGNASTDDSVAAVRRDYPAVRLIENSQNLGFAAGNNAAIQIALEQGFPYIFLLNNDATVAPDAIHLLLQPLLDDPRLGVSGPAICYMSVPQRVWSAGGAIDWQRGIVTSDWYDRPLSALPEAPFVVDHISGCAMMIRSAAVAQAGALDPRFFMYFEETEWCARIARHGYGIVVMPQARVWHDIDPLAQTGSPAIAYFMTRNHLLFLRAARARPGTLARALYRHCRALASLYLTRHSPERTRGRWPMVLALRDFVLGHFGPTTLPRRLH